MATTPDRTLLARFSLEPRLSFEIRRPKIRRPTLMSMVSLNGLWALLGVISPDSRPAVYACVPSAFLISSTARRARALRTPTAMTFLASLAPLILIVFVGVQVAPANLSTARDRMIIALAMCVWLAAQEGLSRVFPHPDDLRVKYLQASLDLPGPPALQQG